MIHFYAVMFIAVVLIVSAMYLAAARVSHFRSLAIAVAVLFVTGGVLAMTAISGVIMYRGYSHFDPKICAQVVWDDKERHWTCITWEEAG